MLSESAGEIGHNSDIDSQTMDWWLWVMNTLMF